MAHLGSGIFAQVWTKERKFVDGVQAAIRGAMRAVDAGFGAVAALAAGEATLTWSGGEQACSQAATAFFGRLYEAAPAAPALGTLDASQLADLAALHLAGFQGRGVLVGRVGRDALLLLELPACGGVAALEAARRVALEDAMVVLRELFVGERKAEALSRQLFEASPDAMIVAASDGRIVRANGTAERLLGYTASELAFMGVDDLVPPEAREQHTRHRHAYAQRPTPRAMGERAALHAIRRDGTPIPVDIRLGQLVLGDDTYALAVVRDMTARAAAEAALRDSEEQLRQSQRLELLGQFAASIAHDFNNLLTVVGSQSELMGTDPACPPGMREDLKEVTLAAERAGLLTRQLLAFARHDAPLRRPVDVAQACEAFRTLLERLIGGAYRLDLRVAEGVGVVLADTVHLEQILMNVVVNARDAMPGGGTISVVVRPVEMDAAAEDLPAGRYVSFEVGDTGCGIPPEVLARIFEPLFTTKAAGRGTGLGLAIVRRVVRECGGAIRVRSRVGEGTTFTVLLPRLAQASAQPARASGVTMRGLRVLVVDDEPVNLRVMTAILVRRGYRVTQARSAEEALKAARADRPDLVLSDASMPGMSGPALVHELRVQYPDIRAAFVTGDPLFCQEEATRTGTSDVPMIQKPFSVASVIATLAAVLGDHPSEDLGQ